MGYTLLREARAAPLGGRFQRPQPWRDDRNQSQRRRPDCAVTGRLPVHAGKVGTQPVRLGLVVDTTFTPGARWQPKRISPGEGVLTLLANSPAGRVTPARVFRALAAAASTARVVRSPRGEATRVARRILQLSEARQD